MRVAGITTLIGLLTLGCSCSPHAEDGLCSGPRPDPSCDVPCSDDEPCPSRFYCSGGVCTADCDPLTPGRGCPDGVCRDDGRCERLDRPDAQLDGRGDVCADVTVSTTRVTPNVILIVDQSGSMTADFGPVPWSRTRSWRRSRVTRSTVAPGGISGRS